MSLEIRPANLAQVTAYKGRMVEVTDDVTDVARQLKEIDEGLTLVFADEAQPPYWTIYYVKENPDGSLQEDLVLTTLDLGSHIVERVRKIDSERYDYVAELEATDAAARKAQDDAFSERVGDIGEQLAHAIRKDLGETRHF